MKKIIVSALAIGLGLSTAAIAQTTSSTTSPRMEDMMPQNWMGSIGDAFYTDNTWTTLRAEPEIKTRWETLSAEQQAMVKDDCTKIGATNPGMTSDPDTLQPSTNGSVSGSAQGSLQQVCAWVKNL
jgi:hypothetical protein